MSEHRLGNMHLLRVQNMKYGDGTGMGWDGMGRGMGMGIGMGMRMGWDGMGVGEHRVGNMD